MTSASPTKQTTFSYVSSRAVKIQILHNLVLQPSISLVQQQTHLSTISTISSLQTTKLAKPRHHQSTTTLPQPTTNAHRQDPTMTTDLSDNDRKILTMAWQSFKSQPQVPPRPTGPHTSSYTSANITPLRSTTSNWPNSATTKPRPQPQPATSPHARSSSPRMENG
jgi:hypothetical protein